MNTLEHYNKYDYACHISEKINIFLNKNIDGQLGIILVPKNKYEPVLLECINDVEISWYDVSTLAETRHYTRVPADMCNEYYIELVRLNS